jgi:hypothetical protein
MVETDAFIRTQLLAAWRITWDWKSWERKIVRKPLCFLELLLYFVAGVLMIL